MSKASQTTDAQPEAIEPREDQLAPNAAGTPMPPAVAQNVHFREEIWPRMHWQDQNWVMLLIGETGSGKSWAALRTAEVLDPNFSVADNVHFGVESLLQRATETEPAGTIDVLDEANVAASAKAWWELEVKRFADMLETWRAQNRGLVLTAPELNKVATDIRDRFHHVAMMEAIDYRNNISKADFREVKNDRMDFSSESAWRLHPSYTIAGRDQEVNKMKFRPPTEDVREAYAERKSGYMAQLNEDSLEEVQEANAEEEEADLDAIASDIEDTPGEFISEHPFNGMMYFDKDLIRDAYDLSVRDADTVKKKVEQEVDADAHA